MGGQFRLAAWTVLAFGLAAPCMAFEAESTSLSVTVYDQASVASGVVERAQRDAASIFDTARVSLAWTNPSAPPTTGSSTLRLIIRRQPEDGALPVMGTAIESAGACSGTAFVFYTPVLRRAHASGLDVARLLAYAMAHELGHLLVPPPAHARTGIMRPQWNGDDLRRI